MRMRICVIVGAVVMAAAALGSVHAEPIALVNGTILDGNGGTPIRDGVLVIDGKRITAVGGPRTAIPVGARRIDVSGKYLIPGMMDANAHLVYEVSPEFMVRFEGQLVDIAKEAAQVALKAGLTTLFDTWGPLEELKAARDQINRGEVPGSRVFIAGNIIGVNGPLSRDFYGLSTEGAVSAQTFARINARWEQGMGKEVIFLTPDELRARTREYMDKGVDFIKIGVSGHGGEIYGLLNFSPQQLQVMVDEARARGMTVQTHTMTMEALRIFAAGDFDLAQHCSTTLREAVPADGVLKLIPDSTVELLIKRKRNCTLNAYTEAEMRRRIGDPERKINLEDPHFAETGPGSADRADAILAHQNEIKVIKAGVTMLMVTDAGVPWIDSPIIHRTSPCWRMKYQCLHYLGEGHIAWLRAVHEKGMQPMEMLKAATRNVAVAYRKLDDLGTLERGKLGDVVVLNSDPLTDPEHYADIFMVMKDGQIVDRDALPVNNVLTKLNAPRLLTR